jgi:hypothetical protein
MALALTSSLGLASASAAPSAFTATNTGTKAAEYPANLQGKGLGYHSFGWGGVVSAELNSVFEASLSATTDALPTSMYSENAELNGCSFTFHTGEKTGENTVSGTADLGGASCTGIHVKGTLGCSATILPQTLPVTYTNSGKSPQTVEVKILASNVEYEGSGNGCPKGHQTDGNLYLSWSMSGTNEAASALNVQASPSVGLHWFSFFVTESYPALIYGDQTNQQQFQLGPGLAVLTNCNKAHFSSLLPKLSSTLNVAATYSDCHYQEYNKATMTMNSCKFVYHGGGTLDIACSKEGDSIEAVSDKENGEPKCTALIGPQEGLKGVTFTTLGEGSGRSIEVAVKAEGVTSTTTKGVLSCGTFQGVHTEGILTGTARLYGVAG